MSPAADNPALPPFTGMALDRASTERKDAGWIRARLGDPASRAITAGHDGVLVRDGGRDAPALVRGAVPAVPSGPEGEPILLGLDDDTALFAVDLDGLAPDDRSQAIDGNRVMSLREAGALMAPAEAGLAAYVMALLNWHRRHRFCANCGNATDVAEAGYSRRCPHCGANHFPRTDPVVIMTVESDDRMLLGRRTGWPPGRLSVLAGFVSPGESAEEAVTREVQEESGIIARDPVFVASQPWPFPASLMLGFHAVSDGGEPRATDDELDEVGWYPRDAIQEAIDGGDPGFQLPPPVSIARFLIDRWAAGGC
ncbi:MAG TPA: NAD(+) diphosphatase [Solirubrobacteraceae bacterium]|jgi:NAD+ diphosphatase|nr:NAD(+) diphosphatase [Solirubrobacteraceae bacterium]